LFRGSYVGIGQSGEKLKAVSNLLTNNRRLGDLLVLVVTIE